MRKTNVDDGEWTTLDDAGMDLRRKQLGQAVDGEQLGCSCYELPAESRAWPTTTIRPTRKLFVLLGSGRLRCDGETASITEGDYVQFPANESGAHRIINDSAGTLRYLLVSTMIEPDITVYPDSEKFGVYVGGPAGRQRRPTARGVVQTRCSRRLLDGHI